MRVNAIAITNSLEATLDTGITTAKEIAIMTGTGIRVSIEIALTIDIGKLTLIDTEVRATMKSIDVTIETVAMTVEITGTGITNDTSEETAIVNVSALVALQQTDIAMKVAVTAK